MVGAVDIDIAVYHRQGLGLARTMKRRHVVSRVFSSAQPPLPSASTSCPDFFLPCLRWFTSSPATGYCLAAARRSHWQHQSCGSSGSEATRPTHVSLRPALPEVFDVHPPPAAPRRGLGLRDIFPIPTHEQSSRSSPGVIWPRPHVSLARIGLNRPGRHVLIHRDHALGLREES